MVNTLENVGSKILSILDSGLISGKGNHLDCLNRL